MPLSEPGSFCVLPWIHLSSTPEGQALPCCVAEPRLGLGHLSKTTLESAWNAPRLKALRLDMLAGRRNPICAQCHELEDAGCESLRAVANRKFARHALRAKETKADGALADFAPAYVDIRFSKGCNLRCRTCGPAYSSAWKEESRRLAGPLERLRAAVSREHPVDPKALLAQLEPLLDGLDEIYFAGGEPLLNEEHYRILDLLAERKLFHVRLDYNTNFSVAEFQGRRVMELWDRFESVDVRASLDASGARAEYLRKGLRWSDVPRLRAEMKERCPRARFSVFPTLGAMNALHLPDCLREWVDAGLLEPSAVRLNLLLNPDYHRLQVLPAALKDRVERRYEQAGGPFLEAVSFMRARDLTRLLPKFRRKTRELDALRGESFAAVFPEMAGLMG